MSAMAEIDRLQHALAEAIVCIKSSNPGMLLMPERRNYTAQTRDPLTEPKYVAFIPTDKVMQWSMLVPSEVVRRVAGQEATPVTWDAPGAGTQL